MDCEVLLPVLLEQHKISLLCLIYLLLFERQEEPETKGSHPLVHFQRAYNGPGTGLKPEAGNKLGFRMGGCCQLPESSAVTHWQEAGIKGRARTGCQAL